MSDDGKSRYEQGEAILNVFKRGAEFTEQLLAENERLRAQLSGEQVRQTQAAQDDGDWEKLRQQLLTHIDSLELENKNILEQLLAIESENKQFADRYLEVEEENNNLANLYVASYQLHSTLDWSEVLNAILEIVINLIGADVFCIYLLDESSGVLEPIVSEGRPHSDFQRCRIGEGVVGESLVNGEVSTSDSPASAKSGPLGDPVISIPLRVQEQPVGAIAIHSVLQQKEGFTPLDQELFRLLAGHAATALFAARLYSQSERKLSTIQGLIDLLSR